MHDAVACPRFSLLLCAATAPSATVSGHVSFPYHAWVQFSFMGTIDLCTVLCSTLVVRLFQFSVVDKMPSFKVGEIKLGGARGSRAVLLQS